MDTEQSSGADDIGITRNKRPRNFSDYNKWKFISRYIIIKMKMTLSLLQMLLACTCVTADNVYHIYKIWTLKDAWEQK